MHLMSMCGCDYFLLDNYFCDVFSEQFPGFILKVLPGRNRVDVCAFIGKVVLASLGLIATVFYY